MVNSQNFAIFGKMEQQRFIELLKDPQRITKHDAEALLELRNNFPYFQLSHLLITLAAHQNNSIYFEEFLKKAALITTDRKKLKRIIDGIRKTDKGNSLEALHLASESNVSLLQEEFAIPSSALEASPLPTEALMPALVEDPIFALSESVLQSSSTFAEIPQETPTLMETGQFPLLEKISTMHEKNTVARVMPRQTMEHTILHTYAVDSYRQQEHPFENEDLNAYNGLISQLLENHAERPKTPTLNAIDQFLQNPPKAKKTAFIPDEDEEREDLSEKFTNNSAEFFSESLANIYKKQGKYAKAIETYKKLILTNPQKSAYFASKILEIENLI